MQNLQAKWTSQGKKFIRVQPVLLNEQWLEKLVILKAVTETQVK